MALGRRMVQERVLGVSPGVPLPLTDRSRSGRASRVRVRPLTQGTQVHPAAGVPRASRDAWLVNGRTGKRLDTGVLVRRMGVGRPPEGQGCNTTCPRSYRWTTAASSI